MINSANRWSRRLFGITAFLLLGFGSGVAWFAGLLPVTITGVVGYDVSRIGFSMGVITVLISLLFRPGRQYGLAVALVGFVLGISSWAVFVPFQMTERLMVSLTLFGAPLGIVGLLSFGFIFGRGRSRDRDGAECPTHAAAVPRRFGLGTMMIVVLAASILFGLANWLHVPAGLSVWLAASLGIIGGFQVLMHKAPRAASVVAGAVLFPLTMVAIWTAINATSYATMIANVNRVALALGINSAADVAFLGAHFAAIGAAFGYLAGVLVAGLFLLIEYAGWANRKRPSRLSDPCLPPGRSPV